MSSVPGGAALVLVLGSNVDAHAQLARARAALATHGAIAALSREVDAPSHAAGDASVYANQALALETAAAPGAFRTIARDIEAGLGRRRGDTACALDIDIVAGLAADGTLSWHDPAKLAPPLFVALACDAMPPPAAEALRHALATSGCREQKCKA